VICKSDEKYRVDPQRRTRYMRGKPRDGKYGYVFFSTINPNGGYSVYLSAYGQIASTLLQKYVEGDRADNEEWFDEWDKSVQKASSQAGFKTSHKVEDGYIYISTYENGIGMPEESENNPKKV
jgi:hypothetical protein